jgi:enoyl-CoA hydratase/carnithine racemase
MTQHLCTVAPLAIERLKQGIRKSLFESFEEDSRYEEEAAACVRKTVDATGGLQAFMEKPQPQFEGR